MKRRYLLSALVAVLLIAAMLLPACGEEEATPAPTAAPTETATLAPGETPTATPPPTATPKETPTVQQEAKIYKWNIQGLPSPGSWSFDEGMTRFAERIAVVTGGRLQINCFGPGGIVPFGETMEAVRTGTLDAANWWTCYDVGMRPVTALWGTSPFGFNDSQSYFDWMYYFGGLELMNECYNEWNIVVPCFSGAGAAQIAGQSKTEKRSYYDMSGYIFRSSGLAAEVLQMSGMETIFLPAAELFTAIERGVIDVVEYAGPNWNYRSAYHEVAPFAYGPGWHEPASITANLVNKQAWEELPADIQDAFILGSYAHYTLYGGLAREQDIWGLGEMLNYGVVWNRIPDRDLQILYDNWLAVAAKYSAEDDLFKRTFDSMESFKAKLANIVSYNWDLSFERSELPLPTKLDEKADWEDLSAYIVK